MKRGQFPVSFTKMAATLCLLWMLLALSACWPVMVYAEEEDQKTVRVGYVNALNYEEGGD